MANWSNPSHRVIEGKSYSLMGEGMEKKAAQEVAQHYRNRNCLARLARDSRLGRIRYCVYVNGV